MRDATARRLSAMHRIVFRATNGRVGRRLVNNDMLLLTTRGRSSGRDHTVPLLYLRDGADVIVIASWGGRDYPPDWYRNVVADPNVWVDAGGDAWRGVARELRGAERASWWSRAVAAYEGYATYQDRTERVIPILRIGAR